MGSGTTQIIIISIRIYMQYSEVELHQLAQAAAIWKYWDAIHVGSHNWKFTFLMLGLESMVNAPIFRGILVDQSFLCSKEPRLRFDAAPLGCLFWLLEQNSRLSPVGDIVLVDFKPSYHAIPLITVVEKYMAQSLCFFSGPFTKLPFWGLCHVFWL